MDASVLVDSTSMQKKRSKRNTYTRDREDLDLVTLQHKEIETHTKIRCELEENIKTLKKKNQEQN